MNTYQQDIDNDNRCERSQLIVSQCSHCRGLDDSYMRPDRIRYENCDNCSKRYRVTPILERLDGQTFCTDCAELESAA